MPNENGTLVGLRKLIFGAYLLALAVVMKYFGYEDMATTFTWAGLIFAGGGKMLDELKTAMMNRKG